MDLTETEAQNFEDIDVKKLTKDQEESVRTIVWDYLHSVIIRYLLDDASQVSVSCPLTGASRRCLHLGVRHVS